MGVARLQCNAAFVDGLACMTSVWHLCSVWCFIGFITASLQVVENALAGLPLLFASLDSLASPRVTSGQLQLMSVAKLANAALCALGGFQESIKPGCLVQVSVWWMGHAWLDSSLLIPVSVKSLCGVRIFIWPTASHYLFEWLGTSWLDFDFSLTIMCFPSAYTVRYCYSIHPSVSQGIAS